MEETFILKLKHADYNELIISVLRDVEKETDLLITMHCNGAKGVLIWMLHSEHRTEPLKKRIYV